MSFDSISQIIASRFGKTNLTRNVTAALVCEELDKILKQIWGEKMENLARAMYLKDKVLFIACLSPVVAQEIVMREREIKRILKEKFGEGVVERVRLLT